MCQFLVSVSKESSSTAEVLESISRSVRVKPENLRLAEVRHFKMSFNSVAERRESRIIPQTFRGDFLKDTFSLPPHLRWERTASSECSCLPTPWTQCPPLTCYSVLRCFPKTWPKREWYCSKCSRYKSRFYILKTCEICDYKYFNSLVFALQKLQVPNIPISKCAACLKPPVSEEDKLKRCTRCYRVGYCNQ